MELRKGTRFVFALRAETTFPNAKREVLIAVASFRRWPVAPEWVGPHPLTASEIDQAELC